MKEKLWRHGPCAINNDMVIDKNKIKAVIFDWGGVCCREAEPFASSALQKTLGLDPNQIAAQVPDIYFDYYRGKYNRETFWRAIMNHFGLSESDEIHPTALSQAYLDSYEMYPEVLETAKKLKQKGYLVALLSNLTPEMREHVRPLHRTAEYFQPEMYSCDANVAEIKPNEAPYLLLLEQIKMTPDNCLFIDNTKKNLAPAEKMGMQTIFFKTPQQFLEDIKILL